MTTPKAEPWTVEEALATANAGEHAERQKMCVAIPVDSRVRATLRAYAAQQAALAEAVGLLDRLLTTQPTYSLAYGQVEESARAFLAKHKQE